MMVIPLYSIFHLWNVAHFWQRGLTSFSYYIPSGRDGCLEHRGLKDLLSEFYLQWWWGYILLWGGLFCAVLIHQDLSRLFMYLVPSGIWIWGVVFFSTTMPTWPQHFLRPVVQDWEDAMNLVEETLKGKHYPQKLLECLKCVNIIITAAVIDLANRIAESTLWTRKKVLVPGSQSDNAVN